MFSELERSVEVLQRTPAAMRSLLLGVTDFWAKSNYGPDTFSPFDVIGHLIHAEQTNFMTRAKCILGQAETPLPAFDRYAMFAANEGKSIDGLLEEFVALRSANLAELRRLNPTAEQLELRGSHPQLGSLTLRQLLSAWVVHDLGHLHQIAKAMAYQYRDAVGPFRRLLTILPKNEN